MKQQRIYLDCNATAPLRPPARAAMNDVLAVIGNPSSVHAEGRVAHRLIEDARAHVATLVDCAPPEVIFTSGASEANNMAIGSHGCGVCLVVEHHSVLEAQLSDGTVCQTIGVDADGAADLKQLDACLGAFADNGGHDGPALVSVQLANSETGIVQDLDKVIAVAREHSALVHTDAVQAVGKVPVSFRDLGVDFMSVSAHKFGGPMGAGALIVREGADLSPLVRGGSQENRKRAGTENVTAIAGFGAAAKAADAALGTENLRLKGLRDELELGLRKRLPQAIIVGDGANRLPNTTTVAVPGSRAETLVIAFDLEGVAVSAGSACSSGKVTKSHVLDAIGLGEELSGSAIRISTGWATTETEIDRFLEIWEQVISKMRQHAAVA